MKFTITGLTLAAMLMQRLPASTPTDLAGVYQVISNLWRWHARRPWALDAHDRLLAVLMTFLKRTRVEDFEEAVVPRPLRNELDRALVREPVEELDLLSEPSQSAPTSPRRR